MRFCVWIGIGVLLAACDPRPITPETNTVGVTAEHPTNSLLDAARAPTFGGLGAITERPAADDPIVQLGKQLFHDMRLSRDDTIACASCHDVGAGGDDGRPVSVGVDGRKGALNAPTVLNSGLNFTQFWDGRARTLTDQATGPVGNPLEMDSDWSNILPKLRADADLREAFSRAGLDSITEETIVQAIVAYENALVTMDAPLDRWLLGDSEALSPDTQAGAHLFVNFGCVSCHQGRNIGGNMFQRFGITENYFEARGDVQEADLGRYNVTGRPSDRFVFKVPSLRNVSETAPYFHDGSVASLDEAVGIMGRYQLGRQLSSEERRLLVAFLESLTGTLDERLL